MPRSHLRDRARDLRAAHTHAEAQLWNALRDRRLGGWKWRRQVPVGPYIVDFLCKVAGLVVEVDGATHDDAAYDVRRTAYLERCGLRVMRVSNQGIYEGRWWICDAILAACGGEAPHLTSPRSRGEGGERNESLAPPRRSAVETTLAARPGRRQFRRLL